ncbi:MAG: hypothetical protein E7566_02960 [Ruminococcaceae bacterium]|nr:hypothetical protein [Oscillospiraceae bacterium]
MKRFFCVVFVLIIALFLVSCSDKTDDKSDTTLVSSTAPEEIYTTKDVISSGNETNLIGGDNFSREEFYREHQNLTSETSEFNPDTMLRVDLSQVGLENVYIKQISESLLLDSDTYGKVYLLADDRYGGAMSTSDHYLLVTVSQKETVNGKMYIKDLSPEYLTFSSARGIALSYADLDGDKDKEIILHECKDIAGGAGQYLARIYDFKDGIEEIFTSYDPDNNIYETGFSCTLLKDNIMRIDNSFTGYTLKFEVKRENEEYFTTWWYDEEGNPKEQKLWVDSFNSFEPCDIDDDGISEIMCRQYTCLVDHTDYVGSAISVLKYNTETKEFYVFDASFEPDVRNID